MFFAFFLHLFFLVGSLHNQENSWQQRLTQQDEQIKQREQLWQKEKESATTSTHALQQSLSQLQQQATQTEHMLANERAERAALQAQCTVQRKRLHEFSAFREFAEEEFQRKTDEISHLQKKLKVMHQHVADAEERAQVDAEKIALQQQQLKEQVRGLSQLSSFFILLPFFIFLLPANFFLARCFFLLSFDKTPLQLGAPVRLIMNFFVANNRTRWLSHFDSSYCTRRPWG